VTESPTAASPSTEESGDTVAPGGSGSTGDDQTGTAGRTWEDVATDQEDVDSEPGGKDSSPEVAPQGDQSAASSGESTEPDPAESSSDAAEPDAAEASSDGAEPDVAEERESFDPDAEDDPLDDRLPGNDG
jgi:hypothetical protein